MQLKSLFLFRYHPYRLLHPFSNPVRLLHVFIDDGYVAHFAEWTGLLSSVDVGRDSIDVQDVLHALVNDIDPNNLRRPPN